MLRSEPAPKRSGKWDDNQLAPFILITATSKLPKETPAAAALGRLGGLKGGAADAKKLSKRKRKEIARFAAITRWFKETSKADDYRRVCQWR